ncbi:hypothetical protein AJ80_00296 [Polytolypa hystricis UAMH7299]|uniref:Opsin n=1 Tax=Polytolypa hystricis (strain UAMH7299) TaxID=1447883 RepID=A0A2B7Z3V5_POLH7|nr:hypothetical protein AJ80_00296 [Polytolypa hystricis UAMH7299]
MIEADSFLKKPTPTVGPVPTVIPGHEPIYQVSTGVGHRCLWVVAILMLVSSLIFYILAARVPVQKRLFHVLASLITTISFLAYFAMATGDGIGFNHIHIVEKHHKVPDTHTTILREVYWARFINWALTTPLILINLTLLAGLNGASLLIAVVADLIMFFSGLMCSYGGSSAHGGRKWAWFTIAALSYLTLVYKIGFQGSRATANKESRVRTFYSSLAGYSLVVLLVYPIIWAASANARRMSIDAEIIVYAILDILLQGVFGYWLLVSHDVTSSISLNSEGFWAHGTSGEGGIRVGEEEGA